MLRTEKRFKLSSRPLLMPARRLRLIRLAKDGFYLHRAFIDGGEVKSGFFMSKYHMTVTTTGSVSVPVSGMTTPTASIT